MYNGSWVALITPFNSDNKIDFPAFEKLLMLHKKTGTKGIVLGGTTGEGLNLTPEEHHQLIKQAKSLDLGLPIVGTVTSSSFTDSLKIAEAIQKADADVLMISAPPYIKTNLDGLLNYISEISKNIDKPIMFYDNPKRSGSHFSANDVIEILKLNKVIGIKDAAGDPTRTMTILSKKPDALVFAGDDDLFPSFLSYGAVGVISALGNVIPEVFVDIHDAWVNKDIQRFYKAQQNMLKYLDLFKIAANPMSIKYACHLKGMCENYIRPPLALLNSKNQDLVRNILAS